MERKWGGDAWESVSGGEGGEEIWADCKMHSGEESKIYGQEGGEERGEG